MKAELHIFVEVCVCVMFSSALSLAVTQAARFLDLSVCDHGIFHALMIILSTIIAKWHETDMRFRA